MKFAFSTVAAPSWDFETIASRAKEYGYDGVEIRGFLDGSHLTSADIFLSDAKKIRALFEYHQIEIACLSSSISMTGNKKLDRVRTDELHRFIDTAAEVGCSFVKVFDSQVLPGGILNPTRLGNHSRMTAGVALGDWLLPIGDYAAQRDMCIVVENALSFKDSKEMWLILDRLAHPSIACCWDVFNAALIGEMPAISVPTLNSKIQFTQVKDAKLGTLGANYCKLGDGDVRVKDFLTRLRGIGYQSWVSFEWEKAWLPNIAPPEEVLPGAITKLREWTKPQEVENKKAKKEASDAAPAAV